MSKLVKETKQALRQAVLDAMGKAVADGALPPEPIPAFTVEVPAVQRLSTWPHAKLRRKF